MVATLADELRALGDLSSAPDLARMLGLLLTACVEAVPSTLAVRVTSPALGPGRTIESAGFGAAHQACRASLRLQLLGGERYPGSPAVQVTVVILAGRAGAFNDFVGGADPLARPGVRIVRRTVDEDVSEVWTEMDTDLGALDDAVTGERIVQRAVGVLIEGGLLPDEAIEELQRHASGTGSTLLEAAWDVLRSTAVPDHQSTDGG